MRSTTRTSTDSSNRLRADARASGSVKQNHIMQALVWQRKSVERLPSCRDDLLSLHELHLYMVTLW